MSKFESFINYCPPALQPAVDSFPSELMIRDENGYPIDADPLKPIDLSGLKMEYRYFRQFLRMNYGPMLLMYRGFFTINRYSPASINQFVYGDPNLALNYGGIAVGGVFAVIESFKHLKYPPCH